MSSTNIRIMRRIKMLLSIGLHRSCKIMFSDMLTNLAVKFKPESNANYVAKGLFVGTFLGPSSISRLLKSCESNKGVPSGATESSGKNGISC